MILGPKHEVPSTAFQPNVVLFGYGALGESAIETLSRLDATLVGVVVPTNRTGPDVVRVENATRRSGLPLLAQPRKSRLGGFLKCLKELAPDLIVVWSYSMILPPEIIRVPRLGCINLHGGLLPEYRGGHVMQWAIINGERETGVTLHYINEAIDTGPIIAKAKFPIESHDDGVSVQHKLQELGATLLSEWWQKIIEQTAPKLSQDEAMAQYYRLLTPSDGLINWSGTSVEICNLVRALVSPRPGAYTFLGQNKITLRRARKKMTRIVITKPGTVQHVSEEGVLVATGDAAISITELDVNGSVVASPKEFTRIGIRSGIVFADIPAV